jgi:hypothetical protein
MYTIENIISVINRLEDWDSNYDEILLYKSDKNKWNSTQEIEFLYRQELYFRRCLQSLIYSITDKKEKNNDYLSY